jgi:SNF2 family DNA or RNA helicase
MIDPWWNPAVERQAVDRAHRIGQQKSVFIYKFITKDTVEEKILALQEKKKNLADSLITTEESFIKNIDVDEIMDILT